MKNLKALTINMSIVAIIIGLSFGAFVLLHGTKLSYAFTTAPNTVAASATVSNVCYITSVTGNVPLAFGTMLPGSNTINANFLIVDTDTNGNAAANILIQGGIGPVVSQFTPQNSVWQGPSTSNIFIGNTVWSPTNVLYASGNTLTNALINTNIQVPAPTQGSPTTTQNIFFGMAIPPATTGGVYNTNIIFEDSC